MKLFISTIALVLLTLPEFSFAQASILGEGFCSGTSCSACNLVELANNLIGWLIGMVMILFACLAVYAGFGLVTSGGNPSALNDAKSKFTNAFIGLLIVLSAWLIVDTLLRGILGNNGEIEGYGPWSEVQCAEQANTSTEEGFMSFEYEGTGDTFSEGNVPVGSFGTAGAGVVSYAREMDRRQCLYSQANRNGCSGSPGYTDCSDLVNNAFRAAGCSSPGVTTAGMYPRATSFSGAGSLMMGDAVVYRNADNSAGHVVICVSDGCSTVIHARGRGAPDGQSATIAASEQIIESNSGSYLGRAGARVLRIADHCQADAGAGSGPF